MSDDNHTLRADGITATILAHGAELCSLKNADGLELLWQAGPQWPRHAPLLCPFAFRLAVTYAVQSGDLDVTLEITHTSGEMLPASTGGHPAFNWPLRSGMAKENYTLTFSAEEPAPIRRLKDGLLRAKPEPTPIQGKMLALSERLFDDDAVILDRPLSHSVRYAADNGPSLEISWEGFRELGIWSKPGGAPFLCIEPWRGFASPSDFDGEFSDKPGVMQIAPGATEALRYRVAIR